VNQSSPHQDAQASAGSRRILWIILLLAAFLRLYRLDLISISNSVGFQGLNAIGTLRLLDGWNWALAGPLTEEVRSSAFLISLSALVGFFCWSPIALQMPVIVLNLLSVWLLFRMTLRHFGMHAAATAAVLYASSPWAAAYSRLLAPASCLAFFSILLLDLSLRWLREHRRYQLGMTVLLCLTLPQIHFSGLLAVPWLAIVLILGRRRLAVTPILISVIAGLSVWLPWLRFHQLTGWVELTAWARQLPAAPVLHAEAFLQALATLLKMNYCMGFDYWFGRAPSTWPGYFPGWLVKILFFCSMLMTVLFLAATMQSVNNSRQQPQRFLVLWIVLSLLQSMLLRNTDSPDGMLIALPCGLMLIAAFVEQLRQRLQKTLQLAVIPPVILLALGNVAFLTGSLRLIESGDQHAGSAWEFSLAQRQRVLNSIVDDAGSAPVQIVGLYSGWYPAYEYILQFLPNAGTNRANWQNAGFAYWVDELAVPDGVPETVWKQRKERMINPSVSAYLRSPPDWTVDRHWKIEKTHIYRLRFDKKQPLR